MPALVKATTVLEKIARTFCAVDKAAACTTARITVARPPARWILDSGAGEDLIGRQYYSANALGQAVQQDVGMTLETANGDVEVDSRLPVRSSALGGVLNPWLCDETPAVISLGRACAERGYSFTWKANEAAPTFTDENGNNVDIEVVRFVPFVVENGKVNKRRPDRENASTPAAVTATKDNVTGSLESPPRDEISHDVRRPVAEDETSTHGVDNVGASGNATPWSRGPPFARVVSVPTGWS